MTLSSKQIDDIGNLYENIVSSNTEQLVEYAAGGTGPTAATLQKQRQAQKKSSSSTPVGVTAKVGPVTLGVTNPKTDIGKRSADFFAGLGRSAERAINRLGGYSGQSSAAPAKPSAAPARPATAAPATRPTAAAPATRPAARPAARPATASAPARPATAAQGGMATWAAKYPQLAARVTPAGTQRGTGQSVMAKQADELRGMQKTSQAQQAAQSGPMYSSPDVKSKMSSRTKTMLGLKDSYDIVLDYLLSQGHVDTLEEALYVMMQMDAENIRSIVEGVMPEPINPAAHKAAQKTQKIYNLGRGTNNPNEAQSALKRTGPQLPGV